MEFFKGICSELRQLFLRNCSMNWLDFIKTHPGDIIDGIRMAIQIAHKLLIKRRKRRLAQKIKKTEEQQIWKYQIPKQDGFK
jgi:hypothetical protein